MKHQKNLFVPLKKQYFNEYLAGLKTVEYRRYGPRWNETTCRPGRGVTLSCGYSGPRLTAFIDCVETINSSSHPAMAEFFGENITLAAIALTDIQPAD